MKIIHNKKVKYLLVTLAIMTFCLIGNPEKIYGLTVRYNTNIEVYTTQFFYVSGSGNWRVCTIKSGVNPNQTWKDGKWKDIVKVSKVSERGVQKIKVEALNAGKVRIYVRDEQTWVEKSFDINVTKRDITRATIGLSQTNYTYNNVEKLPKVTSVKLNGYNIYDYYVQYRNNVKAGTATVYVVGTGNNTGTAWRQFSINKRDISNGKVELYSDIYTYTGGQIKPNIKSVTINNGATEIKDYKVEYYNNVKAGIARVVVTGTGSNTGSITKYFNISKRDISRGHIEFEEDTVTYTNHAKTPKMRVWLDRTEIFDYDVTYLNNNVKPGIVRVQVTGKGSNTGSIIGSFVIQRRDISNAKVTLEYDKTVYDGTYKHPKVKSVILANGAEIYDYSVKYTKNKNIGTANVYITGNGGNTGTAKANFNILKQNTLSIKNVNKVGYSKIITLGDKSYKVYNQGSFSRNIPSEGCSITSEAIVLSAYGINKSPDNLANEIGWNFPRSLSQVSDDLNKKGVSSSFTSISPEATKNKEEIEKAKNIINNNLKNGKPVIMLLMEGDDYEFTKDAHYIVLVGYNENSYPIIANPNGGQIQQEFSLNSLIEDYMYYYGHQGSGERGYVVIN